MLRHLAAALSAIQNGYSGKCASVPVPRTFLNYIILMQLYENGYIGGFQTFANYKFKVELKYLELNEPAMRHFKIISKPSQRIFMSFKQLKYTFATHDFVLLQSSITRDVTYIAPGIQGLDCPSIRTTGIITLKDAIKFNVGGEVLLSLF